MANPTLILSHKSWLSHTKYTHLDANSVFNIVQEWVWNVHGRRYNYVSVNGIELNKDTAMGVLLTMGIYDDRKM